jgi:hypothetical protein
MDAIAGLRSSAAFRSYRKTAYASLVLAAGAVLSVGILSIWLPSSVVLALGLPTVLGVVTVAGAGILVLTRSRRAARGQRDLYLELNRSREPAAIRSAPPARVSGARRWLGRRLLGHDLLVGDTVEVRTWPEIRATLDAQGCLDELPFMPEMLAMSGRRARVFRCMHRLFDHRKTRRMRQMHGTVLLAGAVCDGSSHGGCEAACHMIWKTAWLRKVDPAHAEAVPVSAVPEQVVDPPKFGTHPPRYTCQLTQLSAASQPAARGSLANFLLPLVSGNVTPSAFVVAWLTYLFNEVQHLRGGIVYPTFDAVGEGEAPPEDVRLSAGEQVVVRSAREIRTTLTPELMHRGLWLDPDMLKHCGQRHRVQAEVGRLIDIVTGEMLVMKTPAYILEDVHFSGERQLFNAQYEPLFWRAAWLRREER